MGSCVTPLSRTPRYLGKPKSLKARTIVSPFGPLVFSQTPIHRPQSPLHSLIHYSAFYPAYPPLPPLSSHPSSILSSSSPPILLTMCDHHLDLLSISPHHDHVSSCHVDLSCHCVMSLCLCHTVILHMSSCHVSTCHDILSYHVNYQYQFTFVN